MHVEGTWFKDDVGRTLILRGVDDYLLPFLQH